MWAAISLFQAVADRRWPSLATSDRQDVNSRVRKVIDLIEDRPVGEDNPVPLLHSGGFMNMPEQMKFRTDPHHALPQKGIAVVDLIRKVKNIIGRLMGDKNVRVRRYIHKIILRTPVNRILEEHRHAVEFDPINLDSGITEIVAILVKPLKPRSPKTKVVIAGDEDLVPVGQIAEPFHKVQSLPFGSHHSEIP